jgi:hypothetical protein
MTVPLPEFLLNATLSRVIGKHLPNCLSQVSFSEPIVFDWSEVCFFDDYALLKLVLLQRGMRARGGRVSNRGFSLPDVNPNSRTCLRQLWAVGLPELTASGHLFSSERLKDTLNDDTALLESDPLEGVQSPTAMTAVVPMLCCHERQYFTPGSREEKRLDSFIRTSLRPAGPNPLAWDLIETREFRHLMLQQLRRNVREHMRSEDKPAIGLAIVRVWTSRSLSDEWGLTEDAQHQLLRA